jgi:hypothetical protein
MFANGLGELIISSIPKQQIDFIQFYSKDIIDSIYKYKNSALGIMESITSDYGNLELDASKIQQRLSDPESLGMLKEIIDRLG